MNQVVLLNNKTSGRDKLARLVQYASKITWHFLQKYNASGTSVDKIKNLEYILGNFRRLLRLGRCLDSLYLALNLIHREEKLLSVNCALSKVSYSMYLLCDHIIWFGRAGLTDVDTVGWNRIANKYWLLTIVINLIRDYYEIENRLNMKIMASGNHNTRENKLALRNILEFYENHKDVVLDTVKNGCDIFIPLAALNYINLSPATVGLLGVISSLVGIYSVVDPMARLPLS